METNEETIKRLRAHLEKNRAAYKELLDDFNKRYKELAKFGCDLEDQAKIMLRIQKDIDELEKRYNEQDK